MATELETFVIVGAGLAGAKAAETLREEGFDGRLTLIGDEPERPYERPPLSKDYLRGETDEAPYVHDASFYDDNDIELLTSTRVTGIELGLRELLLEGDRRLGYDRLLLATGSVPRRLDVPGGKLDGIHYLRTLADSERIGERIETGRRLVVVGSGWIGAEIAASARQKGCEVTMIEMASLPLERVLGPEVGQIYLDLHRDHGVEFLPETTVERFEGEGSVERVVTRDGAVIETDFVVVGIGVAPRTGLVETAGLKIDNGVVVDEHLETSAPGVFAAGDVANAWHPFYGHKLRVEHWANALNQGPVAAKAMLGQDGELRRDPVLLLRPVRRRDGVQRLRHRVGRGRLPRRRRRARVHRLLAQGRAAWSPGMNMNVWDVSDPIRELIRSRRPVSQPRSGRSRDVPALGDSTEPSRAEARVWASEGGS